MHILAAMVCCLLVKMAKLETVKRPITLALILLFTAQTSALSPILAFNQEDPNQKLSQNQEAPLSGSTPELKPDSPKLDKPKPSAPACEMPAHRGPLKGSIQHQEMLKGKAASINGSGSGSGQLDGRTGQGKLDSGADKGIFRGKLSKNNNSAEAGLGIIGVKFAMVFGRTPIIYEVFPGTPAAEVGMRPRDIIIAVDGIPTTGLSKDEVYNMIVGQPNTNVTISFKRKNDFQVRQITRMDLNKITNPFLRRDYLKM